MAKSGSEVMASGGSNACSSFARRGNASRCLLVLLVLLGRGFLEGCESCINESKSRSVRVQHLDEVAWAVGVLGDPWS